MDAIILKKIGKDFCFVCIHICIVLGSEVRLSVKTVFSKLFDFYQKPKKSVDNILGRCKGSPGIFKSN